VAPNDYTAATGTLTFGPNVTTQPVNITIQSDFLDETDETFNVNLFNPTNAVISDNVGVGTIVDDDGPPNMTINDISVTEGNSGTTTATFTISLATASAKTITVNAASSAGTATANVDYVTLPSTLVTFNPGVTTQTVNVTVN